MAIVALGGFIVQWRRSRADTDTDAVGSLRELVKDYNDLREQLEVSQDQEEDCQKRYEAKERELSAKLAEIAVLEKQIDLYRRHTPIVRFIGKLARSSEATVWALDQCRDGIVTTDKRDGAFLFTNRVVPDALGMTKEEFCAKNWREMIHPDDIPTTEEAEALALGQPGVVRNRYRHVDGHYVELVWHHTSYEEMVALSIVHVRKQRTLHAQPFRERAD